jgi:hypothetical protein
MQWKTADVLGFAWGYIRALVLLVWLWLTGWPRA